MSVGTLFSGFGGVDLGAAAAGLELAWGVEYDADIAAVAHANLPHDIRVANLLDCDPHDFARVDVLHASPPCPNFSVAKAGGVETDLDIALARKVAEFVTVLKPSIFTLENVWAYRGSQSWAIIQDALHGAGYWVNTEHVNAADHGVPQTRKRMIVRAIKGGFVPYLPEPVPWVGWYAAIEDLLPTLPESAFAPWQLARLPEMLQTTLVGQNGFDGNVSTTPICEPSPTVTANHNQIGVRAFLMPGGGNTNFADAQPGKGCRYEGEPSHTVTVAGKEGGAMPRAYLVEGQNASRDMTVRESDAPAYTIGSGGGRQASRALLATGRVVSMTPRALARFQSFPDSYELPDNARLAAKGIGNAVPPLLYQRVIESLMEVGS